MLFAFFSFDGFFPSTDLNGKRYRHVNRDWTVIDDVKEDVLGISKHQQTELFQGTCL